MVTDEVRKGDWMQTASGKKYWPIDPRPNEVDIEDIAASLSNLCRYNGHCQQFYSVAEHSVLVSQVVPDEYALVGLLHDAPEAYCADVPRPLKRFLEGYAEIEAMNWWAVATHFGLPFAMPDCVKEADNAVLLAEKEAIMAMSPGEWTVVGKPADVQISCWSPSFAATQFLNRFVELTTGKQNRYVHRGMVDLVLHPDCDKDALEKLHRFIGNLIDQK